MTEEDRQQAERVVPGPELEQLRLIRRYLGIITVVLLVIAVVLVFVAMGEWSLTVEPPDGF